MTDSPPNPTASASRVRFVFFREDGRTFGIGDEPTPEDYDHARVGLHAIVRLTDLSVFGRSGEWTPIGAGVLAQPEPGVTSPPYHVPERFAE